MLTSEKVLASGPYPSKPYPSEAAHAASNAIRINDFIKYILISIHKIFTTFSFKSKPTSGLVVLISVKPYFVESPIFMENTIFQEKFEFLI